MTPLVSIIIPGFNRPEPLKFTLRSAATAAARLPAGAVETIVVDDGSAPALAAQLGDFDPGLPVVYVRQENQGSILARLHGLQRARGAYIQFLDSDDLLHPDKLHLQVTAQRAAGAEVSYGDVATARLGDHHDVDDFCPAQVLRPATDPLDLYLRVQPPPHGPIYRRDYLAAALIPPLFSPTRAMDPAGDVWLYYNLLTPAARLVKVDGAYAAVGPHEHERFSQHWEKLGTAALLIAEAFQAAVPGTDLTLAARATVGEIAFASWRRLPWDFSPAYQQRLLAVWRRAPQVPVARLGGSGFAALARLIGPVAAGRLLRRLRGGRYADCQTLPDDQLARLLTPPSP